MAQMLGYPKGVAKLPLLP